MDIIKEKEIYSNILTEMMDLYEEHGLKITDKRPRKEHTGVMTKFDVTDVKSSEYTINNIYDGVEYCNEYKLSFRIIYVDGFLVCFLSYYKGWSSQNLETLAEANDGKSTEYQLMSFVGYDYNTENIPKKIDNIILPEEMNKYESIIEKAKEQISIRNKKEDEKVEFLVKKFHEYKSMCGN